MYISDEYIGRLLITSAQFDPNIAIGNDADYVAAFTNHWQEPAAF